MSRIRTIKPEMPGHPTLARVSVHARLLMVWLITASDDHGRFVATSKRLAGELYPLDDEIDAAEVQSWLNELVEVGLVVLYDHNGGRYGELVGWHDHQKISKPSPSRLPARSPAQTQPPGNSQGNPGESAGNTERSADTQADLGPRTMDLGPPTASYATTHIGSTKAGGGRFRPLTMAAIARLADAEADASPVPIGNRSAWLKAVQQRIADERGSALDDAAGRLPPGVSPDAVIDEANRYASFLSKLDGAASWGRSRAELTLGEVSSCAGQTWPDDVGLAAVALDAWGAAQTAQKDDVA